LVEGQDLAGFLKKRKRFDEQTAAKILKGILLGVQYLHCHGICHRDLKLDNILIDKKSQVVKIIDFSVSKQFKEKRSYSALNNSNYKMWTFTGTINYLPPEVFKDLEYTEKIDSWGVGVILYAMLTGNLPFHKEYQEDLIESIINQSYDTENSDYASLPQGAKHLISCLLEKDAKERYTIFQALADPWICSSLRYNERQLIQVKKRSRSAEQTVSTQENQKKEGIDFY